MQTSFKSRSGIIVERHEKPLDYETGLGNLIERLNQSRGGYFSSGEEVL